MDRLMEFGNRMQKKVTEMVEERDADERIKRLGAVIKKVKEEMGQIEVKELGYKKWWDITSAKKAEKGSWNVLRRKRIIDKKEYNRNHKERKKLLRSKREEEKKRFMEEVDGAVKEGREWEVINKERKKRQTLNIKLK